MRIMGLDLGDKRIGVALSDPLGLTAQGLESITCRSVKDDVKRIKEIACKYEVGRVVVGYPANMDGSAGPRAEMAKSYAARLAKALDLPVELWDERLTTVAAEKLLLKADVRRSKRRRVIDQVAAALILQSYLDSHKKIE